MLEPADSGSAFSPISPVSYTALLSPHVVCVLVSGVVSTLSCYPLPLEFSFTAGRIDTVMLPRTDSLRSILSVCTR